MTTTIALLAALLMPSAAPAAATSTLARDVQPSAPGCELVEEGHPSAPPALPDQPRASYDSDPPHVELDGTVIVSPPVFHFDRGVATLAPVYDCTLTIRSRRAVRATFQLETMGVVGTHAPNAGYEFVGKDDERWGSTAGPWIAPAERQVTLAPRGVVHVPVRIAVPADPPAGSVAGSINVVSRARASAGDSVVGVESQVASVVLMPTGGGDARLVLRDVEAPRVRWNREAWSITAHLDNDGRRFASAAGRVRVRSIFGNEVMSIPIARTTVLPGGREAIAVKWNRVPWLGVYRWDVRVASDEEDHRGEVTVARRTGWVIALPPWWVLAVVGALVVALLVRRRRR